MWHSLVANFSTAAVLIALWLLLQDMLLQTRRDARRLLFGGLMAIGAVTQMLLPTELSMGSSFDLHTLFVGLAAFLGGPMAAAIAGTTAFATQVVLDGGLKLTGVLDIVLALSVGMVAHTIVGRRTPSTLQVLAYSVAVGAAPLLGSLRLPLGETDGGLGLNWLLILLLSVMSNFVAVSSIARTRRRIEERKLLLAFLKQAPDYTYVKDRTSRFVAVNDAVAKINSRTAAEMRGLTDFDLTSPDRAKVLFDAEQEAMASGQDILNVEEHVFGEHDDRWFQTSKVVVRSIDGEVLGLAGVTRDITVAREISNDMVESRSKLRQILAETADGIASFDRQGTLSYCNDNYAAMFPRTSSVRRSGMHIKDILYAVADTKEQKGIASSDVDGWVDMVAATLLVEGRQEIELFDGRWLMVRTTPAADKTALVVVTDITESRKAQISLADSRNELSTVLSEMSDGIAMFDASARIVFCNDQYRAMFPRTGQLRIPGAQLRDLLYAAVETGEQMGIAADGIGKWADEIIAQQLGGGEEEIELCDGRWLILKTKPIAAGGGSIVVVSDVTKSKEAERGLLELSQQLKRLASTDGLTGLLNRRSFDEGLLNEVSRSRRSRQPIGLIMIDIDRFKAFNDTKGHPAGDECIRQVAEVLRSSVRRPADMVARYGGEELCLILPDTEASGAHAVAEHVRAKVRALQIEHAASEMGVVTISVGVACYNGNERSMSSAELIGRADQALYLAKSGGRDRTVAWQRDTSEPALTARQ
jgi:diguanylate cyclase (GGDEF)-like protein/PAS domain S-box-containing protein